MEPSLASYLPTTVQDWAQLTTELVQQPKDIDISDPMFADAFTNASLDAIQTGLVAKIQQSELPEAVKSAAIETIGMIVAAHRIPGVDPATQEAVNQISMDTMSDHFDDIWELLMENMQEQQTLEEMEEAQNGGAEGSQGGTNPAGAAAGAGDADGAGDVEAAGDAEGGGVESPSAGTGDVGGGNWLVKLAKALADVQSRYLDHLMAAYDRMAAATDAQTEFQDAGNGVNSDGKTEAQVNDDNTGHQADFIRAQAEMTAYSRLFSMSSETTSNVLKSIGEGLTSIARKQ